MIGYLTAVARELADAINSRHPKHASHRETSTDTATGEISIVAIPKEDSA